MLCKHILHPIRLQRLTRLCIVAHLRQCSRKFQHRSHIRSVHDLQILFILRRSSRRQFIDPPPVLTLRHCIESIEGCEELVVSTYTCMGYKCSHRKSIYQRVVERLILIGIGSRYSTISTHRLQRLCARCAFICHNRHRRLIDTHQIACCCIDKVLRIDCACQVRVQIGSLRHTGQKSPQSGWVIFCFRKGTFYGAHCSSSLRYRRRYHQKATDQHCSSSHSLTSSQRRI